MRFSHCIGSHNLKSFFSPSKLIAMKNNFKYLVWVILFAFSSCKKDDGFTVVEGRLFDSSTNKGINDVTISLVESNLEKTNFQEQSKILTDADGHYRFQFIASSNSLYRVSIAQVFGTPPFFEFQSESTVYLNTDKKQTINFNACFCSRMFFMFTPTQGLQTDSVQIFSFRNKACDKQLQPYNFTIPSILLKRIMTSTDFLFEANVASNLPYKCQIKRFRNGQVVSDTTIIKTPLANNYETIETFF